MFLYLPYRVLFSFSGMHQHIFIAYFWGQGSERTFFFNFHPIYKALRNILQYSGTNNDSFLCYLTCYVPIWTIIDSESIEFTMSSFVQIGWKMMKFPKDCRPVYLNNKSRTEYTKTAIY